MICVDSRSDDLPAADRLTWWGDRTRELIVPTIIEYEHDREFRAAARLVTLRDVLVSRLDYLAMRYLRPAKLVRQSDPEQFLLALNLRGGLGVEIARREAQASLHDFLFYDTSHPFTGWTADGGETASQLLVQIPKALFPLPPRTTGKLVAERLPGREGIGALLANFLADLTRHAPTYQPADVARLATITVDLVAAACAHHFEAEPVLPGEARRRVLRTRIHDFVQRRLGDPGLSPGAIAAAHGISLRYLHDLFHGEGVTVAAWIRQRRLERCRRDLADPHLTGRSIERIAVRWGFPSAVHFSRVFRAAYGIAPRDYRQMHAQRGHEQSTEPGRDARPGERR